ncbi:hypothetical protein DFS34DRAFT_653125 [Phlyctochytrium arcticum]|nr:hypothetical protein DFS34DRAFT_653125 [Phlyctochytrium arcticum]
MWDGNAANTAYDQSYYGYQYDTTSADQDAPPGVEPTPASTPAAEQDASWWAQQGQLYGNQTASEDTSLTSATTTGTAAVAGVASTVPGGVTNSGTEGDWSQYAGYDYSAYGDGGYGSYDPNAAYYTTAQYADSYAQYYAAAYVPAAPREIVNPFEEMRRKQAEAAKPVEKKADKRKIIVIRPRLGLKENSKGLNTKADTPTEQKSETVASTGPSDTPDTHKSNVGPHSETERALVERSNEPSQAVRSEPEVVANSHSASNEANEDKAATDAISSTQNKENTRSATANGKYVSQPPEPRDIKQHPSHSANDEDNEDDDILSDSDELKRTRRSTEQSAKNIIQSSGFPSLGNLKIVEPPKVPGEINSRADLADAVAAAQAAAAAISKKAGGYRGGGPRGRGRERMSGRRDPGRPGRRTLSPIYRSRSRSLPRFRSRSRSQTRTRRSSRSRSRERHSRRSRPSEPSADVGGERGVESEGAQEERKSSRRESRDGDRKRSERSHRSSSHKHSSSSSKHRSSRHKSSRRDDSAEGRKDRDDREHRHSSSSRRKRESERADSRDSGKRSRPTEYHDVA